MTIALVTNSTWNVYNYRLPLLRRLTEAGHRVLVLAPVDEYIHYLNAGSFTKHIPLQFLSPKRRNPFQDLRLMGELYRLYRREQPDLILHFTVKPNIWGNLAARLAGIPSMAVITGLGFPFLHGGLIQRTVARLYKLALHHPDRVIFFNPSDRDHFISRGLADRHKTRIIPGSGVDTEYFQAVPIPENGPVFLYLGRLLYDKGLREFAAAAEIIQSRHPKAECWIVGELHAQNPAAVREEELLQWMESQSIRYFGAARDVRPYLRRATAVVLPSYREGLSRALLEAMAMARPVITTDVPGCREVVVDGETGYLVPPKNTSRLAAAMERLLDAGPEEQQRLGENGRRRVLEYFDQSLIMDQYLQEINSLLPIAATRNTSRKRRHIPGEF